MSLNWKTMEQTMTMITTTTTSFICMTIQTQTVAKAMFRNQNYITGQLRYFDNNLSRTSKQAEIIRRVHLFIDQTVYS